ncbi:MAG: ATP-binding protein [Candidatus Competibacteraceae bacterium]|nr:ATP-binding protein [Candidatus Competibacteraceae bacterium]
MTLPRYLQPRPAARVAVVRDENTAAYRALLGRWLIDLALLLGWAHPGRRHHPLAPFSHHHRCWDNDEFLALTGLADGGEGDGGREGEDEFEDNPSRFRSPARFVRLLKKRRRELAGVPLDPDLPLVRNIGLLAGLLELDPAEQAALCFALLLDSNHLFKRAVAQQSQPANSALLYQLLAGLTGLPAEAFRVALRPNGVLCMTGLLKLQERNVDLEDKLDPGKIAHILLAPHADAEALMSCVLKRVTRRSLTVDQFPHLAKDTAVAVGLLQAALRERLPGTNLLLYGPPGVGKTEYAAALAQVVGAELYEVDCADEDGDPIRGERRLQAFNLGQRLLARRGDALLLFDEVEDVFKTDPLAELFGGRSRASGGKAWTNRALETNPVPALWLTNHAKAIDAAHLRRFDYSIHFSLPPQSVRLDIARHHLGEWAGEDDWLATVAARAVAPTGYDLRLLSVDQDIS